MSNASMEELASSILEFQANIGRLTYRRKMSPVDTDIPQVQDMLGFIWQCARLDEKLETDATSLSQGINTSTEKWIKVGFGSEHIRAEFARVGMLGLDCLVGCSCLVFPFYNSRFPSIPLQGKIPYISLR